MEGPKLCLQCGEQIIGRLDKKFCGAQCRNTFNNKVKRSGEKTIIEINRILRRNRKILKQFNPEGKTTVRKEVLKGLKFDFAYHTHIFTSSNGNAYKFCYEYGYLEVEDGQKVLIVNEQPYMKP